MEKLLVVLILFALSVMRLYFRIRFHALFGIKAFRYEPLWILLTRYVLGIVTGFGFYRYLYGGRRLAAGIVWDLGVLDWIGAILALAGLALLLLTHRTLDGSFSTTIDAGQDHRLITDGPYARIRHPMYVSYLAIFTGLLLMTWDVLFCGPAILIILSLMFLRVPHEERALQERFGVQYSEYRARVGAFIPRTGASVQESGEPSEE